ncbi:MAG: RNA polymerase-associated protein RapA [Endozoicomonadaceae bacterium]|nr:RNA polymerase-associated protein RapA [Endozoicomonadaceae bacterium]
METLVAGQRWISEAELDQGLGTLLKVQDRRITIFYPKTGKTRVYQLQNNPLYRMIFGKDDVVKSHEGWKFTIVSFYEKGGLITYKGTRDDTGETCELAEVVIDGQITFTRPRERILSGQLSKNSEFNFRYQALKQYQHIYASPVLGLCGNRISLIPHQLHIASEVGNRFAPRVLLADEVGLGKTVEAGLILNRQLLTGRIQRILVIVPEVLIHQWLVEMLRRFNLHFTVLNKDLYNATDADNPFDSAQFILISKEFLCADPQRQQKVKESQWDMLVVDEAHQLQWSEKSDGSPEYNLVAALSAQTPGVLLLTATPEQLGQEGHFARLSLLDPACFHSLSAFKKQEEQYKPVADLAKLLCDRKPLTSQQIQQLHEILEQTDAELVRQTDPSITPEMSDATRKNLLKALTDRYGISRILFRNTRSSVSGFPERIAQGYPLEQPELYQIVSEAAADPLQKLYPEILYRSIVTDKIDDADPWWKVDPRVEWLSDILSFIKDKVLIICAHAATAIDLENSLRLTGQYAAVFHEQMSIIERDRAAAWFSDEEGVRVMICSEIGSEGRNFQFAHHLILFDLPYNPDLLEQRIGRLDRIGQQEIIKIHIPFFCNTAQENLFRWYYEGINAFNRCCPAGSKVFSEQQAALKQWIFNSDGQDKQLIETTRKLNDQFSQQLEEGRDTLIELSSAGDNQSVLLKEAILQQDKPEQLKDYLESLFDCFGVEAEEHGDHSLVVRAGGHMRVHAFPGLRSEEAVTITFDRDQALHREEMMFISPEHPMVREGTELLLASDIGNTAVSLLKNKALPPGTILLEAIFVTDIPQAEQLFLQSLIPPTIIHILLDPAMRDLVEKIKMEDMHAQLQKVKNSQARKFISAEREKIKTMIRQAESLANERLEDVINKAIQTFSEQMDAERRRIINLKAVNPNIRDDEIALLDRQAEQGQQALHNAVIKSDAVRVIVTIR